MKLTTLDVGVLTTVTKALGGVSEKYILESIKDVKLSKDCRKVVNALLGKKASKEAKEIAAHYEKWVKWCRTRTAVPYRIITSFPTLRDDPQVGIDW